MACCPSVWYCTPDGPAEVEADEDGHYTPPADATGGPHATQAEAEESCEEVLGTIDIGGCRGLEGEVPISTRLTVTFVDGPCAGTSIVVRWNGLSTEWESGAWVGFEEGNDRHFTLWPCFAANYSSGSGGMGYGGFVETSFTASPFELVGTISGTGPCGESITIIVTE